MDQINFLGGLLLGLASTLHCATMCGGIAGSLLMGLSPDSSRSRQITYLLSMQAGRVVAYMLAGATLSALGAAFYGLFDQRDGYRVLQWSAAATLAWIGLSLMGLVPALSIFDRILSPISRVLGALRRHGKLSAPLVGLLWGFLPCGMVYAALFYATLSGSAIQGALVMAGFGLGTLPAVTLAAFGYGRLMTWARRPQLRRAMGAVLVALAPLSLLVPTHVIAALC